MNTCTIGIQLYVLLMLVYNSYYTCMYSIVLLIYNQKTNCYGGIKQTFSLSTYIYIRTYIVVPDVKVLT